VNTRRALPTSLKLAPVVPVMVIENVEDAVPLARALVKGGLPVLEITLRTAKAMDCIRAIIAEVEGAIVGSGTVLTPEQLRDSFKLGCNLRRVARFDGKAAGGG
jgi:2-dehydro-3-deoxyphosphogluconate aldolase / (4S)-4-hydroxy-2-oxoglutarate aldolase